MAAQARPYVVFTYHKTGTVLFENIMRLVAPRLGMQWGTRYGLVRALDRRTDVFILAHSLLGFPWPAERRAVRIVRDPRDIWLSGYRYHRRCNEGWCTNADLAPREPIGYPQVDFSVAHRDEAWKRAYLGSLGGRSYQQNLLERDESGGLMFELDLYTGATMDAIRAWPSPPGVLDVQLETIAADYDGSMARIFRHLGFDERQVAVAVACAAEEDVSRMNDAGLASRPHISGRTLSKWRQALSPAQVAAFEQRHGDVITRLGYALATDGDSTSRSR